VALKTFNNTIQLLLNDIQKNPDNSKKALLSIHSLVKESLKERGIYSRLSKLGEMDCETSKTYGLMNIMIDLYSESKKFLVVVDVFSKKGT